MLIYFTMYEISKLLNRRKSNVGLELVLCQEMLILLCIVKHLQECMFKERKVSPSFAQFIPSTIKCFKNKSGSWVLTGTNWKIIHVDSKKKVFITIFPATWYCMKNWKQELAEAKKSRKIKSPSSSCIHTPCVDIFNTEILEIPFSPSLIYNDLNSNFYSNIISSRSCHVLHLLWPSLLHLVPWLLELP